MFRYGFEVEGFAVGIAITNLGQIHIPPLGWATDGFPGLLEARSTKGKTLEDAYFETLHAIYGMSNRDNLKADFATYWEHKFSGPQMAELRRSRRFDPKDQLDIKSIYGKEPRALNGKTLASCQINISNLVSAEYSTDRVVDGKIEKQVKVPEQHGMLDISGIVRRLDTAFAREIKSSNRQPGFYAIKDTYRLEYRSLPNFVFPIDIPSARVFLAKIKKAVEG